MNKKIVWPVIVLAVVIVAGAGYWFGSEAGAEKGYAQAQADIQQLNEEAAAAAAQEAAAAANPFQTVNPLEGVEANPFEKAKKVLNPFE